MNDPNIGQLAGYVVLFLLVLFVVIALVRSVRIVPQAVAIIVEESRGGNGVRSAMAAT